MHSVLSAQNVTIINNYDNRDKKYDDEGLVLKNVTEHTYIINEYEPANRGEQNQLEQMISFGLRSHIDNTYRTDDGIVQSIENPQNFNASASAIVQNALWIYDADFELFPGFSDNIRKMVEELKSIDGYQAQFGDDDLREPRNGRVGLYIFQRMVYDLKAACENEVGEFLDDNFGVDSKESIDEGNQMLSPGDYVIPRNNANDEKLTDIKPDPQDLFPPDEGKKSKKKRRRKDEQTLFNERIVQLLEENNRILSNYNTRFEDLQTQIDEIRQGGGSNEEIKDEIAELRAMIIDLANGREINERDGSRTKLVNNERITVLYDKNQHILTTGQKAELSNVRYTLRDNPGYTAVITGYADKMGNAKFNAWISRKRALAVRDYLLSQGIPKYRMVVNFLGDEESLSPNPADRKVEVQYILNYTVQE